MSRFRVKDTFEIPSRKLFVIAGSIVEGVLRSGMLIHIPFNSSLGATVPIYCIGFARRQGGEDVCLCVEWGLSEILRGMDMAGEILEVTTDDHDEANDAA